MIELTLLPGKDGDCLLLSYGDGAARRRVLVDGGRAATYQELAPVLAALDPPGLDLLVVTHVDQDHVLGVLALFADPARVPVREVWFNGFDHLKGVALETFGARDGELLTTALMDQKVPWNRTFEGAPVEVDRPWSRSETRPTRSWRRTGTCWSGSPRCGSESAASTA